jgi:anti-sigma B factor antagonist
MSTQNPVIVMEVPSTLSYAEGRTFLLELLPLLETDRPHIVLDCAQLRQVDSAGIEILLECMDEAMKRDGDVKLATVSPESATMMELMRVDRLFEIFDTVEEAKRSFRAAPQEAPQALPWYSADYGEAKAS